MDDEETDEKEKNTHGSEEEKVEEVLEREEKVDKDKDEENKGKKKKNVEEEKVISEKDLTFAGTESTSQDLFAMGISIRKDLVESVEALDQMDNERVSGEEYRASTEQLSVRRDSRKKSSQKDVSTDELLKTPTRAMSIVSRESLTDEREDEDVPDAIQYEWESELEEYDEPDIYPSEKDYQWVEELIEDLEDEVPPLEKGERKSVTIVLSDIQEEDQKQEPEAVATEQTQEKKQEEPTSEAPAAAVSTEPKDDTEETFEEARAEPDQEPELEPEPPKKKYKKILVKKLIERPPKIHYDPFVERQSFTTNDPSFYTFPPLYLVHSFGYDSQRMANLHVLDEKTLVYMSGFVLTFLCHETMEKTYLKCLGGSCFGALAIHPSRKLFAAAEKGKYPLIGIWSWPKLQLFRQLKEGTDKVYASVNFSPNGRLLASQGGSPDYLITVWNWLAETPVLRVKSHAQDVYRVTFSKELAGRLTTSGLCHIKFWKMADTFTGLKLKGDLGRFGRSELSDIEGYVEMPDGKVLSGTEWGNLLVWENGLIIAELCTRIDIPCHFGIIRQVLLSDGEFYTTGQDGWVKTWNFDAVDTAEINTSEESIKVPIKVMAQVQIAEGADIWSIVPNIPNPDTNSVFWFAQDGNGAIWKVDLSFLNTAKEPDIIFSAHGGPIVGCQISDTDTLFATLGQDGHIKVYNFITNELVAKRHFSSAGSCLLWPPLGLDDHGATIIAGFADGTFRVLNLSGIPNKGCRLQLILQHVKKPHSRPITTMSLDREARYFVTGSRDGTIFFFDAEHDFTPMVFIALPDYKEVQIVRWCIPSPDSKERKVLVVFEGGLIKEMIMPQWDEVHNENTYHHIENVIEKQYYFKSIKSQLRHNEELERERVAEEARQAALEDENRKRIDEGMETQSEQDLRLLQEAEEFERLRLEEKPKPVWVPYIPPKPSDILCIMPGLRDEELFLSMGQYDAGYIYHIKLSGDKNEEPEEPISAISVEDSDDVPITAYAMSNDGDQIIFGFQDGRIRIQKFLYSYDLENFGPQWTQGVHDCVRGAITAIALDKFGVFMVSCGRDGNCFLHSFLGSVQLEEYKKQADHKDYPLIAESTNIQDIIDPHAYTLEMYKNLEKEMALLAAAKKNKAAKKEEIMRLRHWYCDILRQNLELPEENRLTKVELAITSDNQVRREEEITAALKQLNIEMAWSSEKSKIALEKMMSAYKDTLDGELFMLKAFRSNITVTSFRLPKIPPFFQDAKDRVEHQRTPHAVESDIMDDDLSSRTSTVMHMEPKPVRKAGLDKFIYQRMVRLWERKQKKAHRQQVWRDFLATEPKGKELREEDKAIEKALANMGDMKLKMSPDYKVPEEKKLTEHRARKKLVFLEEIIYNMKKNFNNHMLTLRESKIEHIKRMNEFKRIIQEKQSLLSDGEIIQLPHIDQMTLAENPHSYLEYTKEDIRNYQKQIEEKMKVAATQVTIKSTKKVETTGKRKPTGASGLYRRVSSTSKVLAPSEVVEAKEDSLDLGNYVEDIPHEPTLLEIHIAKINLINARYYQHYYSQRIEEEKIDFDVKLKMLRHKKMKLDFLLKIADERMVLLTDEFILAQRSEAMEASIENKIVEANKEKKECTSQLKVYTKKSEGIKKDLETYAKMRAGLLNDVLNVASKVPGFEKYLIRVFNKKVAKPKPKPLELASSTSIVESDEDSESSSDMDIEDDEEDDDGLDIDLPPPELNKEAYDQVLEIRQKRFVIDEAESALKETFDDVNSNINQLKNKMKDADKNLESGRKDLEAFIKEKQQRQNNLDCAVSLKLHQIFILDSDMRDALVTGLDTIQQLRNRIPELRKETVLQKRKGKEIKKQHFLLQREKQKFAERLEEMKKRCDLEMKKKFGVVRNIEELENYSIDPEILALRHELGVLVKEHGVSLARLEVCHRQCLTERVKTLQRHAVSMYGKADMVFQVNEMTKDMYEQMSHLPSEYEDLTTRREIAFLKAIVLDQTKVIRSLKEEIAQFTTRFREPLPPIRNEDIPTIRIPRM
ncbi:cilia- and flagella-associated protein 44-like [Biomphalaria glabrata]|uniref:Cilia- and flagella-associated protein 44-like n=1 Tax=Biomphalaria glabrata TaxID=6526 RepID=A0A9W2Z5J9_BIOGL|nr:cilia- and flagella-associated protein 44-like [Biomphalaria glabrata]